MCELYIRYIIQQMQQSAQRDQKPHWSAAFLIFLLHSVWLESFSHFTENDGKQLQQPSKIQKNYIT